MPADPEGLLEKIPELQVLREDAAVASAIESGDPMKVYGALRWAHLAGRLNEHRELLRSLLSRRRAFAMPLKGSPTLFTMNSIGLSFVGGTEKDPQDGTEIATHSVVIFFKVPLVPLAAYLVKPTGGSSYQIFARVPLSLPTWLYRQAIALAAVVALAGSGLYAANAARFADVRVVNAFDESVVIRLGAASAVVAPHNHVRMTLPLGRHHGVATSRKGVPVDELDLVVRPRLDLIAWNLAGAAPLFRDVATYSSGTPPKDQEPSGPVEVYCGQRVVEVRDLDYVMTSAPQTVDMNPGEKTTTRSFVMLADTSGEHNSCQGFLASKNRLADALPAALVRGRLSNWADADLKRGVAAAMMVGTPQWLELTREAVKARPDSVEAHRWYQEAAEAAGQRQQALEEYQRRAEAEPESATAQYLAARLLTGHLALDQIERLAKRFPDDDRIGRSCAYQRLGARQWKPALQTWEALRARAPAAAAQLMEVPTWSLAALGDRAKGLRLMEKLFAEDQENRGEYAEQYALLARSDPTQAPDALIAKMEKEDPQKGTKQWYLRARAGLSLDGAPDLPLFKVMRALAKAPKDALQAMRQLSEEDALGLPIWAWALAYGEALRVKDEGAAAPLKRIPILAPDDVETFARYVRGESASMDEVRTWPSVRAAANILRARNSSLPDAERRALIAEAHAWDPVRVTDASEHWPP